MIKHQITAILWVVFGFVASTTAQESTIYTHKNKDFQDALALYHNEQYQAAQNLFDKVRVATNDEEVAANSAYYAANAAVRLNQRGAEVLMENFVNTYPTSTKRNAAFADVAEYYFETGKYPYALKWYNKVDQSVLSSVELDKFYFNYGYALFSSRKQTEAKKYLEKVANSTTYGSQAQYYLGYIAYQQDDYEGANERFDQITDPQVLEEKLSYYQADMNFKLGKFEEAIALAKKQLAKADRKEVSELNKIIGESYFNLKQYQNAIPYLSAYKGRGGKWSNTDYYYLGYAHYKQGDFEEAVSQFNKIIGGTNSVAQNAYYHLAECYLKLDKKQEALNAFRNASQMEYKADIKKDAFLNYARLSYEIGNAYEPVPEVITTYLKTYPNDAHQEEMQTLLVDSYITSKNFAGAMKLLEENKNYASKETYQKVAYYRGIELFIEGDYAAASENLEKSIKNAQLSFFKAKATYWKAEADYLINKFDVATVGFKTFLNNSSAKDMTEYDGVNYSLGYAYFKQKKYTEAITYFKAFTNQTNVEAEKLNDGYVRLADSYFATRSYWPAIETYNKALALRGPEKDYAAYQKAMSYGYVDRVEKKIQYLENFVSAYDSSSFRDDALFELGNTYISEQNETKGLAAYDRLISEFKGSSLVPQAIMRQGLVHYNAGRNEAALSKFKTVVRQYPKTQEAIQAVSTAKLVYVDLGRVNEYAQWASQLDFVEVTDTELDNATFEAAQKQNIEGNIEAAIKGYQNYIRQFPKGIHALDANFTLAQLYFGKGAKEQALPYYQYVADRTTSEYAEQALTRVCEVFISKNDYSSALPYLLKLEAQANIQQNRTFARSNLMKGYYQQKQYNKTLEYAEKVLATANIDDRIKSDAQIMIARSAVETNDMDKARTAYMEVLKIASGATAAEALYYNAYFEHEDSNYENSNLAIQKLAKDYATYKKWGGKGLVLMAKNFNALNDAYQATYILDSVIQNFEEFPEIVAEASAELAIIKSNEAKSNSSIQTNQN